MNKKSPVSGLPITENPEWKFKTDDGLYSFLFNLIGGEVMSLIFCTFKKGVTVFFLNLF